MLRCFRKLAKPVASISLIGFIGQFLFICCMSVANASIDTAADARMQSAHCHGSTQTVAEQHHNDASASPDSGSLCVKHDNAQQMDENCCAMHNVDQPFFSGVSRELKADNSQQFDFVALLTDPVTVPDCTPIRDIPLKPGFERPRFSTPTYLANCSFLE
jgi:hypothetical protein